MTSPSGPLAGAGSPRRREQERSFASRAGSWLVWWAVLMSFWIALDYSLDLAELLVGAGVAAAGASAGELVAHQTASHFRIQISWLASAFGLPGQVLRDTVIVFAALWRRLVRGDEPASGFLEVRMEWGDESPVGMTRRVLITGATSVAPNTFVLGMDRERDVMVVHHLVLPAATK